MKILRLLVATALCFYALSALAQWQWLDKDGRRVFSDRPPPAEVPEKNILKRPSGRSLAVPPPAAAPATHATVGLDKALQDKRKQAEDAEAAKRKADEERNAQIRAENCQRAQQAKAGLDAGGRMATINANGEREYMDDAGRAAESQRLQGIINENCR